MTPRRILALGWLAFMLYAYPGYMNLAAAEMLIDARYATISDLHSPMLTELWRIVNIIWTGPPSMLFLQSGLLLFGAFVLFKRAMSERAAAICAASLLFFPPVMVTMAVISADAMLAGLLVMAAALFTCERRWVHGVGLFLGLLACGMRDGAWIAAGPIIVFGFTWDKRRRWRYAIAANAWIAVTLLAFGLTYLLVDRVTGMNDAQRAVIDITGTLARTSELPDTKIQQQLAPGVRFTPGAGIQVRARTSPTKLIEPIKPLDVEVLPAARERLRDHDFGAWAKTRFAEWKKLVLLHRNAMYVKDNVTRDHRFAAAHAARSSPIQKLLIKLARLVTPLMFPIIYLILAVLALPFARRYAVFLVSGIALEVSLARSAYDIEYRYSTWLIVSTLVALVLIVRSRIASASPGSSA